MSGLGANVLKRITPECASFGPTLMMSGTAQVVMLFVVLILLLVAIVYNLFSKPSDDAGKEKKLKYINGLMIGSAVVAGVSALIGLWHMAVAGKVKKCISEAN